MTRLINLILIIVVLIVILIAYTMYSPDVLTAGLDRWPISSDQNISPSPSLTENHDHAYPSSSQKQLDTLRIAIDELRVQTESIADLRQDLEGIQSRLNLIEQKNSAQKTLSQSKLQEDVLEHIRHDVVEIIQEERRQAQRQIQEHNQEQVQHTQSLLEGEFGDNNFFVNTLTEKLDLDAEQANYFNQVLNDFKQRRSELIEDLRLDMELGMADKADMDQRIQQLLSSEHELNTQMHEELSSVLSLEQRERYLELPEYEKNIGGPHVFTQSD